MWSEIVIIPLMVGLNIGHGPESIRLYKAYFCMVSMVDMLRFFLANGSRYFVIFYQCSSQQMALPRLN